MIERIIKIIGIAVICLMCVITCVFLIDISIVSFKTPTELSSIAIITLLALMLLADVLKLFLMIKGPKKKLKIGLDIHGVCDAIPEVFSEMSRLFVAHGHELHILTGRRVSDGALDEIKELGIKYTHFFSIADHHAESGTKMRDDKNGNPWMDDETWDRTKGDYCKKHNIDFCIDDTERYGKYFTTPFAFIKIKKDEKG